MNRPRQAEVVRRDVNPPKELILLPAFIGILTQSALVLVVTAIVWNTSTAYAYALVGCLILAVLGVWHWREPKSPTTPKGWALYALITPVAGGSLFCIEMVVGKIFNPSLDYLSAGLHTGPFGGILTAICTPVITLVAIGGLARCLALRRRDFTTSPIRRN